MQITVEKFHVVRQLGFPFYNKPRIADRDGRPDIGYRRISRGYDDQEALVEAVDRTSTNDAFCLMQPGYTIPLIEPTLSSLGVVLKAPEEGEHPIIAAVRLKQIIPGVEVTEVVDSTRLREGECVAIGVPDGRSFTIDFIVTRRRGQLGKSLAAPVASSPVGHR